MKVRNTKFESLTPDPSPRGRGGNAFAKAGEGFRFVLLVIYLLFVICHLSFAETRGVYIGVFREGAPRNMNYIRQFEEQFGKKPAMIMWYQDWAQSFPQADAQAVIDYGAVPHIVWEPWWWSDRSKVKLDEVVRGKWDDYIRSWAQSIKEFGHPIFLRWGHEFNADQYPWALAHNGKDPQKYIKAYRHVVDIFKREKVSNVKWVWAFNNYSYPQESWNDWAVAYPGDDYVDWVGIDGYNWGTSQSWSQWQSFSGVFREQMRRARKLFRNKPMMIAEFGSAEEGGDKSVWIKEIPQYLKTSLPDISLIIWFDNKKETDWRLTSSTAARSAFREIMKNSLFSSSAEALPQLMVTASAKAEKKIAQAERVVSSIQIDGNLSDWKKSFPLVMEDVSYLKEGLGWRGPKDLSGRAYLAWDDKNLYLAAKVQDDFPLVNKKEGADIWNGDAIEMVLSVNPQAHPSREVFDRTDYQIGFGVGDGKSNRPTIWNWQRRRSPKDSEIAVKKISKPFLGYVLEAKIPWEFFRGDFTPSSGAYLGFDLAFDDADKTGQREKQLIWNGDYYFYKDPSVWGYLRLE